VNTRWPRTLVCEESRTKSLGEGTGCDRSDITELKVAADADTIPDEVKVADDTIPRPAGCTPPKPRSAPKVLAGAGVEFGDQTDDGADTDVPSEEVGEPEAATANPAGSGERRIMGSEGERSSGDATYGGVPDEARGGVVGGAWHTPPLGSLPAYLP
jgi:hypothetical protein